MEELNPARNDVFVRPRLRARIRDGKDPEFREQALFLCWMLARYQLEDAFSMAAAIQVTPGHGDDPSRISIFITTLLSGDVALNVEERSEGVFHVDLDD